MLQGTKFFNWSVITALLDFTEFSNRILQPFRFIKNPRVFSGRKSNYLFRIKYTTHFDKRKKKKKIVN